MDKTLKGKNIYEEWYNAIKNNVKESNNFFVNVKTKNEILELRNFFLVCQRVRKEGLDGKFNLNITCKPDDVYRIKHYLYIAKKYKNIGNVKINGKNFSNMKSVKFFKRIPLLLIDKEMYEFLGTRLEKIATDYGECSILCESMENKIGEKVKNDENDIKALLLKICINNLLGEVTYGTKEYSRLRRTYFLKSDFFHKVKDMPFLAFFIFSFSIRVQNIDEIEGKKKEIRRKREIKNVKITENMFWSLFLDDTEIESEIFNAWDISDGALQLIENVVLHAGKESDSFSMPLWDGEGAFAMYLQKNIAKSEDKGKEFCEESELFQHYSQYFKGYLNEYRDGKFDETEELKKSQNELLKKLSKGYYVERNLLDNYENMREEVEKRRRERKEVKYFLEMQIADFSGKNMCDVFRQNLVNRNDPCKDEFGNITVRSFFDPSRNRTIPHGIIDEIELWDRYYKGDNAIQHFGLQIFLSIISDNRGYFEVKSFHDNSEFADFYSNAGSVDAFSKTLPGTAYDILLPMKNYSKIDEAKNTFLNTDINYRFSELNSLISDYDTQNYIEEFWNNLNNINIDRKNKADVVEQLKIYLAKVKRSNKVLIFDCNRIQGAIQFEVFVKTIILLIANKENRDCYNNIAIINCNTNSFVKFIRYFSIYYDKNGNCEWMTNKQIYLCGENSVEEFIISGKNMQEMLGRVEKLAFSRRLNPTCLPMLTRMLQKRTVKGKRKKSDGEDFSYTPFDLIIKNSQGQTVFEQNVLKVLEENIQMMESGCKIEPTHMRIGSKLHMHAFYEAELLFFNNYYVNRFAYLLAERIYNLPIDWTRPIWLIGYEAYSEMLICRLKQYIQDGKEENDSIQIHYSIYENSRGSVSNQEENFRYFNPRDISAIINHNAQVLFVVPINSTLTTFNKLENVIKRKVKEIEADWTMDVVAYLGIIQVRDIVEQDGDRSEIEKRYWDDINLSDKYIISKKLLSSKECKAFYQVLTQAKWEDPLKCLKCYPRECLMETPVIETDRTSVVPTQLIGLKKKSETGNKLQKFVYKSAGDIQSLKDYFYFDHVERGSNHYQIYIRTANYYASNAEKINSWLNNIVRAKISEQRQESLSFDVLVNPLHFSNAAFVEAVNEVVFNGASYTLRIEVEKEFRDNVETKFSDLELLYKKLVQMKISAEINIHYVDDSINLGGNYTRMKHVVSSLFPQEAVRGEYNVKVNIFKSVIVLINRLSVSSMCDYVSDINNYFYYLDLRISSMRTHEDACYLCKEAANAEKISCASATNQMSAYWEDQKEKYKKKSLYEAKIYKKKLEEKDKKYYERYFRRILCTHRLNTELADLRNDINEPLNVLKKVSDLIINEGKENFVENLMSYLYAYATPFISYRKSSREGAFTLIIVLLEYLVVKADADALFKRISKYEKEERNFSEEEKKQIAYIKMCLEIIKPIIIKLEKTKLKKGQKFNLFKLLMKLSAELKSNYILREDRIADIVIFAQSYSKDLKLEKFNIYYVALMKKILTLNADESKSARFDGILEEYAASIIKKVSDTKEADKKAIPAVRSLLIAMYLENTVGIRGIVSNLNSLDEKGNFNPFYSDENYKYILKVNGVDDSKKFLENLRGLKELFNSNITYAESSIKNIPFYEDLCGRIGKVLDALDVWCAIKTKEQILIINKENKVVYDDTISYKIFGKYKEKNGIDENIDEIMRKSEIRTEEYLLDTYYYDVEQNIAIVRYKIILGDQNLNTPKEVFIGIRFKGNEEKQIIQKLKFLLLFRKEILLKLSNDFNNNILQEWIEKNRILDQLKKARANSHTDEENIFDNNSVWTLSERFLFGDAEAIEEHKKECSSKMLGCILGLMMNIRIGRSNVLLLSKGEFVLEELSERQRFGYLRNDILSLKNIYFYDRLKILDKWGHELGDNIFSEDIYDSLMEKGKDGYYCDFKSYLLYFIFELFHSAVVNGVEEGKQVSVMVYREKEYLFFKNKVKSTFKKINIERGLRREEAGISLATICEFFIYNYENRHVKLIIKNRTFAIGLPIFTAEEGED